MGGEARNGVTEFYGITDNLRACGCGWLFQYRIIRGSMVGYCFSCGATIGRPGPLPVAVVKAEAEQKDLFG